MNNNDSNSNNIYTTQNINNRYEPQQTLVTSMSYICKLYTDSSLWCASHHIFLANAVVHCVSHDSKYRAIAIEDPKIV